MFIVQCPTNINKNNDLIVMHNDKGKMLLLYTVQQGGLVLACGSDDRVFKSLSGNLRI